MVDPLDSRGPATPHDTLDIAIGTLTSRHWMIDAVRYIVDNGIKWRAMSCDFPPWPRVYAFCAP